MLFDTANPGNVLGGDVQRLPFRCGAGVRDPQMHDTVLHDNLFRPYPSPFPPIEAGQKLGADFAVAAGSAGRRLAADRVATSARSAVSSTEMTSRVMMCRTVWPCALM